MKARIPRQRYTGFVGSVEAYIARHWRAWGMTEGEIAEARSHLVVKIDNDGTITVGWDDPGWHGAG